MTETQLKAPFPAFGGKSRIAAMAWSRLSTPSSPARNYIEPFCFSAAMLLLRPDEPKIETINDVNAYVSNFWRAIQADPEAVAAHADWPVNEVDLHARHRWLVQSEDAHAALSRVRELPDYFDAKIAGWWCWGACMWIGSGWCETQQLPHMDESRGIIGRQLADSETQKRHQLCNGSTTYGQGVHKQAQDVELNSGRGILPQKLPELNSAAGGSAALHQKRPCFPDGSEVGRGVQGYQPPQQIVDLHAACSKGGVHGRPQLADAYSRGRGIHGNDALTDCDRRRLWLVDWFTRLSDRLRPVRVCCGHWMRVCDSDSTLTRLGTTAVFLDPPYRKKLADGTENRSSHIYANDKAQDVEALCDEVQEWSLKWADNPEMRIAVCGLEGEYPLLDAAGWDKVAWKSQGGYGNRNKDNENAARERIWFSPHCRKPDQGTLFT